MEKELFKEMEHYILKHRKYMDLFKKSRFGSLCSESVTNRTSKAFPFKNISALFLYGTVYNQKSVVTNERLSKYFFSTW
jgi:hypothetical protein